MKIIQAILDYDVDLSVRYLCKHFQKFNLPNKINSKVEVTNLMEEKVDTELARKFIETFPTEI